MNSRPLRPEPSAYFLVVIALTACMLTVEQDLMTNNKSTTTQVVGVRLKNEQIAAIDKLTELTGFENRSDCVRAMLQPQLVQLVVAMETKSAMRAATARMKAEREFQKMVGKAMKNSEIQDKLDLNIEGVSFEMI